MLSVHRTLPQCAASLWYVPMSVPGFPKTNSGTELMWSILWHLKKPSQLTVISTFLVEILCIDYGFSAALSVSHLKNLPETFYALPQQALRVSLENVSPVHGDVWCRSDIRWFKKLVKNKTFFARLYQKLNDVTVVLFSERGKIGIMRRGSTLSQKMAAAGFARLSEADCTSSPKGRPSIPWHWKQRIIKLLSEATHLKKWPARAFLIFSLPRSKQNRKRGIPEHQFRFNLVAQCSMDS